MFNARIVLRTNKFNFNYGTLKAGVATQTRLTEKDVEEVRIPVPWGHIAGKWWGPKDRRPILCVHGWQDNAGSFDRLIPHLPSKYSYFAIDFPGHGLSSHFPKGLQYTNTDLFTTIRRIQKYYDWNKISFISHSLGSIYSYIYACLYPGEVDFYVAIDSIKPISINVARKHQEAPKLIEEFFKNDSLNFETAPEYTQQALLERWCKDTSNSVTEQSCKILMKRGTVRTKNGLVKLIRDPRLKGDMIYGTTQKDNLQIAENIKCNILLIKANESTYFERKEKFYEVLDIIKSKAKYFEYQKLPGTHHLHLNTPEIVAPVITSFLEKVDS